jgi:hypothetical protein
MAKTGFQMHHQKKDRSMKSDNKPEKPEIMAAPTNAVMTIGCS